MYSDIAAVRCLGFLERLLSDKTTKQNILWATAEYDMFDKMQQITADDTFCIRTRAEKEREAQSQRTRRHAEVFTPLWVVRKMNDYADEVWFGSPDVFFRDGQPTERIQFPPDKTWQEYVDSRRLEITCGEAPYLVTRYDVESGELLPIPQRVGILDRKLRVVTENAADDAEWMQWAIRAVESTYGYEFQGDNLLIARVNVFSTFAEYTRSALNREPSEAEYSHIANVIAWNLWQMDGLTDTVPNCKAQAEFEQISFFGEIEPHEPEQPPCRIYDWRTKESVTFESLKRR
ncbi:MAG: restriction endonuclease subunit M [Clostridiales bacterium]|nr:restriction endonuclease subunit M [Clostridiales bacterium]